jgi:DNA-binding NarL/FixJ family response regulator
MSDSPVEPLPVALLDSSEVTLAGIRAGLEGDKRFRVVASGRSIDDLTRSDDFGACQVVIVDPVLENEPGDCLPVLLAMPVKVLVHSDFFEPQSFFAALLSGVNGYITKQATDMERLKDVVLLVARRDVLVVDERLAAYFWTDPANRIVLAPGEGLAAITDRQRQIVSLMTEGLTDAEIALGLGISLSTVQSHILNLERSLGARSRFELAVKALRLGLINPSPSLTSV